MASGRRRLAGPLGGGLGVSDRRHESRPAVCELVSSVSPLDCL